MHFERELEKSLVPEWRTQYLNYDLAKRKIQALHSAFCHVHRANFRAEGCTQQKHLVSCLDPLQFAHYDFMKRGTDSQQYHFSINHRGGSQRHDYQDPELSFARGQRAQDSPLPLPVPTPSCQEETRRTRILRAMNTPFITLSHAEDASKTQPCHGSHARQEHRRCHGSTIESPPHWPESPETTIVTSECNSQQWARKFSGSQQRTSTRTTDLEFSGAQIADQDQRRPELLSALPHRSYQSHDRSIPPQLKARNSQSYFRRIFSIARFGPSEQHATRVDAYHELEARQNDFFCLLDTELDKIESFYRMKEEEASSRLKLLRQQLHELRARKIIDVSSARSRNQAQDKELLRSRFSARPLGKIERENEKATKGRSRSFLGTLQQPLSKASKYIGIASNGVNIQRVSARSQAKRMDSQQDYVRRDTANEQIPYKFARRRLKVALREFYRGLELLQSYVQLNQTAFRKINKKYDKAINAPPSGQYMSKRVDKARFVRSSIIESHLVAAEDLYARYFKSGDRKIAAENLRTKTSSDRRRNPCFWNGIFVAGGIFSGAFSLTNAFQHLQSPDSVISLQTRYLLQLYAGYSLALLLFLLFTLNCMIWEKAKINYVFIFDYNTQHVLDWQQLAEIPCFLLFLDGIVMWLNFRSSPAGGMYIYWPLILVLTTLLILCSPFPILYSEARKWWMYSNWRLVLAGFYSVEFRDFYLGDMYCSEAYCMSQIELFFCLYIKTQDDLSECESNQSHLAGFLMTLPAIWRALQCLRRYYDSRSWSPHLANCAKYVGNVLYYMTLSLYRINPTPKIRALFIVIAASNAIYCSVWDIAIDFSLGDFYARYPGLRTRLGYQHPWVYYAAMMSNVVLRQQWIVYAALSSDLQDDALVSFFVGLAEVLRRGIWSLFRVENEHCNNVGKFRACRDIPLPYSTPSGTPEKNRTREDTGAGKDGWTRISSPSSRAPPPTPATEPFDVDVECAAWVGQAEDDGGDYEDEEKEGTKMIDG